MSQTEEKVGKSKADLKVKLKKPTLMKKDTGPIKVDLTKKEENAVQIGETKEIPVEEPSGDSKEMEQEVRVKSNENGVQEQTEVNSPIKEVTEDVVEEPIAETPVVEEPKVQLPENIEKLVNFMQETGGTLVDYVRLNADYSNVNNETMLKLKFFLKIEMRMIPELPF